MGDVAQISAKYTARLAASADDIAASQALRHLAFHGTCGRDSDPFDAICRHVLVEDTATGALMCSFRLLPLPNGRAIEQCYSAQFYELSALKDFTGPMVEMGRFCIHPDHRDPDILRAAWGAMTSYVDAQGVEMLFGCASFKGISEEAYLDAFTLLKDRHIAPKRWLPRIKAPRIFPFARNLTARAPDLRAAMKAMPPLLKTYLAMGGWVSDHAVVDPNMNTLHVFTGLEIGAIPPARARALRAVAGQMPAG
jgi:putative hemolysin